MKISPTLSAHGKSRQLYNLLMATFIAASVTSTIVEAESCPVAPIGGNASGVVYYASAVQFKDLMFQSGGRAFTKTADGSSCDGVTYDGEGWPKIPLTCRERLWLAFHIRSENWNGTTIKPYKSGSYVLLYDGKGKVLVGWDGKNAKEVSPGRVVFDVPNPQDGIELYITNTDPSDYIRNIRVVHAADEATYAQQPFTEEYLNMYRRIGASVIRFMDASSASASVPIWSGTAVSRTATTITLPEGALPNFAAGQVLIASNAWPRIFIKSYDPSTRVITLESPLPLDNTPESPSISVIDFPNRTWEERAKTGSPFQQSSSGLALEYMIQLSNTLKADPWLSIPPAADDNWVRKAAELFKTKLDPSLKPYFEWGNESWNFGYPAYHYSEAMIRKLGLGAGVWIPADAYQAYRFVEISKILANVYGVSELAANRRQKPYYAVLTSQTAWTDRAKLVMDWSNANGAYPTMGHKAHEFADDFAVTFYWGRPASSTPVADATVAELIRAQIDHQNELMRDTAPVGYQFAIANEVIKRGMRLISYEGGTHLLPDNNNEIAQVNKLIEVNRDPRMKDVYLNALKLWQGLRDRFGADKVGLFNQYSMVGQYSKYGYWGQMESSFQDPATAPKHQAFIEWSRKCQTPGAPANLRLAQ